MFLIESTKKSNPTRINVKAEEVNYLSNCMIYN